jgi:hypothetical protein
MTYLDQIFIAAPEYLGGKHIESCTRQAKNNAFPVLNYNRNIP